jgi:hypothetical protein
MACNPSATYNRLHCFELLILFAREDSERAKIGDMHVQSALPDQVVEDTVWADQAREANAPGTGRDPRVQQVADTVEIDGKVYPLTILPAGTAKGGFRGDSQFWMGYGNLSNRPIPGVDQVYIFGGLKD